MLNLQIATSGRWSNALREAAELGAADEIEKKPERTGKQVAVMLSIAEVRAGHLRYLRAAYKAGRFHVEARLREGAPSASLRPGFTAS